MRKFFLACPYGHVDAAIIEKRFFICNQVSAQIVSAGHAVFSQVSMSHPINLALAKMGRDDISALWAPIDLHFMDSMDELIVVDIDGWKESSGVAREIEHFKSTGRAVHYSSEFSQSLVDAQSAN